MISPTNVGQHCGLHLTMAIHLVEENNQALDIEKKKPTTHLDLDKSVQLGLSRVPDLVVHADIFDIYEGM